ncbi:MAG: hypothetical protein KAR35_07355 [Candidatus Heimdallarchaeota archaeon]|nr:hypothetical protein [Candidatus Heimdallarchaeota archaeon]MCK5049177.1 hypothetical protein [Candidatus Heimdallarchaeota archaeon]
MTTLTRFETVDPRVRRETEKAEERLRQIGDINLIKRILKRVFPNTSVVRITSIAEDLAQQRLSSTDSLFYLLENEEVNIGELAKFIQGALNGQSPSKTSSMKVSSQIKPMNFTMSVTCVKEPIKHFFTECRAITCEECLALNMNGLASFRINIE